MSARALHQIRILNPSRPPSGKASGRAGGACVAAVTRGKGHHATGRRGRQGLRPGDSDKSASKSLLQASVGICVYHSIHTYIRRMHRLILKQREAETVSCAGARGCVSPGSALQRMGLDMEENVQNTRGADGTQIEAVPCGYEIDFHLPTLRVMIEVDGPFHFAFDLSRLSVHPQPSPPSQPPASSRSTTKPLVADEAASVEGLAEFVSGLERRTTLGPTLFKQRVLASIGGYSLVSIPYWEWPREGAKHEGGLQDDGRGLRLNQTGSDADANGVQERQVEYLRMLLDGR